MTETPFPDMQTVRRELRDAAKARVANIFSQPLAPILIHQMGKVGSTSVEKTLHAAGLGDRTLHLHYLSDWLDDVAKFHVDNGILPEPVHIFESMAVRDWLRTHGLPRLKVITLVRDPVARQVSDLFQNPAFASGEILGSDGDFDARRVTAYLEKRFADPAFLWGAFNWFDLEIKRVYGIDVMNRPLGELGWKRYEHGDVDLLVFRLEQLGSRSLKELAPFLGLDPARIVEVRGNVREQSPASEVYQRVKKRIGLSPELLDEIYSHPFCRTFYTPEQIARFKRRWGPKQATAAT